MYIFVDIIRRNAITFVLPQGIIIIMVTIFIINVFRHVN